MIFGAGIRVVSGILRWVELRGRGWHGSIGVDVGIGEIVG